MIAAEPCVSQSLGRSFRLAGVRQKQMIPERQKPRLLLLKIASLSTVIFGGFWNDRGQRRGLPQGFRLLVHYIVTRIDRVLREPLHVAKDLRVRMSIYSIPVGHR